MTTDFERGGFSAMNCSIHLLIAGLLDEAMVWFRAIGKCRFSGQGMMHASVRRPLLRIIHHKAIQEFLRDTRIYIYIAVFVSYDRSYYRKAGMHAEDSSAIALSRTHVAAGSLNVA
jgi:hypothetical protein